MEMRFGPAGLGSVKTAEKVLEKYNEMGIKACEIAFTYGPYIKSEEDAKRIGDKAKVLGIRLSIHAPFWINLNSAESEKIEKSKERILECCRIGTFLGVKTIVFHPGFYGKMSKEETYENIRNAILDIKEKAEQKGYTPEIAPEIMGKVNVFGSIEEIKNLVKETGCSFCIDFAHILARDKDYRFEEVKRMFGEFEDWHVHFSGIVYGEKGEKHHIITPEEGIKKLLSNIPEDKNITIINESPSPVEDAVRCMKSWENKNH